MLLKSHMLYAEYAQTFAAENNNAVVPFAFGELPAHLAYLGKITAGTDATSVTLTKIDAKYDPAWKRVVAGEEFGHLSLSSHGKLSEQQRQKIVQYYEKAKSIINEE